MGKLDFGLAMVRAKFAGREGSPPETGKKESPPKPLPPIEIGRGKPIHRIIGSWLNLSRREKVHLPPDKELGSFRRGGLLLKR